MSFWSIGHRDRKSRTAGQLTKPVLDGLPVIGAAGMRPGRLAGALELVVRSLGSCFSSLAVATILSGIVWIADAFGIAGELGLVELIEKYARGYLSSSIGQEAPQLLWIVAAPVLFTVMVSWLLFRIGQGLRRLSRTARWLAIVFLVPACVPPLVLFSVAVRLGLASVGVGAALILLIPAGGALVLVVAPTDLVFSAEYRALVGPEAGPGSQLVSKVVVLLFSLSLLATILLILSVY